MKENDEGEANANSMNWWFIYYIKLNPCSSILNKNLKSIKM